MRRRTSVDALWAEDNLADRDLVRSLAGGALDGTAILTVTDGFEALQWLHEQQHPSLPCVILLDLSLPGLDGIEVLRRIRAHPRTEKLPVVVFTASTDPSHVLACYRAGANSYVVRPSRYEEYLRVFVQLTTYRTKYNLRSLADST